MGACILTALFAQCDKIPKFGESPETQTSGEAKLVRDIKASDYDAFTATKNKLVVVDFWADWCGPCKSLAPKLEAIAEEFDGDVIVGKIDVDQAKRLTARLGVNGIPDVRIYRNGTQVDRFVGDIPKTEIKRKLDAHAVFLGPEKPAGEEGAEAEPEVDPIQPMQKDWIPEGMKKR